MPRLELFPDNQIIGVFRGFREGGLEFHADLTLPYRNDFQSRPMHGQFMLVQLESTDEAILGRVASFSSEGKLSSADGEDFNLQHMRERRSVPEDLREQYLKYRVNIRVLGVVRKNGEEITFVPSHRRLPHVGSYVAFLSDDVLKEIAGHNIQGAEIGFLALGEYIYAGRSPKLVREDWMQLVAPEVLVKFPIRSLVSRRSFIFARAGFGKSNLNKLLFSNLYASTPMVEKRGGVQVPVGTIIFDPDGEYFWPDDKGRPGLCDVPALEDKLVVFTPRQAPSEFYGAFIAGGIKLDIRGLKPSDVIGIALSPERQEQQNVRKLRALNQNQWEKLVDLIDAKRNQTPLDQVRKILGLEESQEAEALAARANVTQIIGAIHDRSSRLMDKLLFALQNGKLCVVDVSQMRGNQALILSGLILRRIFEHNQIQFTEKEPKTIPTIAVVEEAQSVLNERAAAAAPYIAWVKEGRKYDLGALLITQQPGSIPDDILSQGDNWFIFHLLSSNDLTSAKRANAHFSDDLLSTLLNEPIPGQGVFWSSVGGKPYPVALRALSFEKMYEVQDKTYSREGIDTFARQMEEYFANEDIPRGYIGEDQLVGEIGSSGETEMWLLDQDEFPQTELTTDPRENVQRRAIAAFRQNEELHNELKTSGIPWGKLKGILLAQIPDTFSDRDNMAYHLVRRAMDEIFGQQDEFWYSERRGNTTFVQLR